MAREVLVPLKIPASAGADKFLGSDGSGVAGWESLTSGQVTTALGFTPTDFQGLVIVADDLAGADLGAKINTADAALGATAGTILVLTVGTISTAVSLSAGHVLQFGPGTFPQSAAITLNGNGSGLRGAGTGSTILSNTSTTAVSVAIASSVLSVTIEHLQLFRNAVPTSSAHGISQLGTTDNSLISDVVVDGHYRGLSLGPCGYARVQNVTISNSLSHGLYLANHAGLGTLQWTLFDICIVRCVGDGVRVQAVAGPSQVTMGTWSKVLTFANSGRGCSILGLIGVPIFGVRMDGCLWSEDGDHELYFDSYGGNHRVTGNFVGLAGNVATGPGLATGASGTGSGIYVTTNNTDILISGNKIKWNSLNGIDCHSARVTITGNDVMDNGRAAVGGFGQKGINVNCSVSAVVVGNTSDNAAESNQLYAIFAQQDTAVIVGNTVKGATAALSFTSGPVNSYVQGNRVISGTAGVASYIADLLTLGNGAKISASKRLNFIGQAGDVSSPVAGDVWYDTTQKVHRFQNTVAPAGLVGLIYANTADDALASGGTAELKFASQIALAAAGLTVGKVLRVRITGSITIDSTASQTATIRLKLGDATNATSGTLVASTVYTHTTNNITNMPWSLECLIHVRSATTVWAGGLAYFCAAATTPLAAVPQHLLNGGGVGTVTTIPNISGAQTLHVTGQPNDTGMTITIRNMTVEVAN